MRTMLLALSALLLLVACPLARAEEGRPWLDVKVKDKVTSVNSGERLTVSAEAGFRDDAGWTRRATSSDDGAVRALGDALVVTMHYRAMWGEERTVVARRVASDDPSANQRPEASFVASVPPEHLPGYGEMLRYWFTARAPDGSYARKPRREGDVYGAVVDAAAVARESPLPTLHWFVEDVNAARWDTPTESFVAFDPDERGGGDVSGLEFYGKGVTARRRGSGRRDDPNMFDKKGSKDWAKRKFKLDFRGRDFRLRWGDASDGDQITAVEELNLHSSFDEPGPESYLRETLAAAVFARLGVAASAAKHVVLRRNGEFYGLYVLVEQVDDAFLERVGYDPRGDTFKAVHWKYSNLRPTAPASAPCRYVPDWETGWGPCPEVYRYANAKASSEEEWDAEGRLDAFIGALDAVNRLGRTDRLWATVDVDRVTREMAAQTAMLHQDRCTKNYYVHRDVASGKWSRIPWDMEDSFAVDYRGRTGRCDDDGAEACRLDSGTYCIMSCEWWNSPFFCDENHPQDVFDESDGRSTWNHLVNAVLADAAAKDAYLREVKRAIATLHDGGWLENRARAMADRVREDARRDARKWNRGDADDGLRALLTQIADRRETLARDYGALWRNL